MKKIKSISNKFSLSTILNISFIIPTWRNSINYKPINNKIKRSSNTPKPTMTIFMPLLKKIFSPNLKEGSILNPTLYSMPITTSKNKVKRSGQWWSNSSNPVLWPKIIKTYQNNNCKKSVWRIKSGLHWLKFYTLQVWLMMTLSINRLQEEAKFLNTWNTVKEWPSSVEITSYQRRNFFFKFQE